MCKKGNKSSNNSNEMLVVSLRYSAAMQNKSLYIEQYDGRRNGKEIINKSRLFINTILIMCINGYESNDISGKAFGVKPVPSRV